MPRVTVTIELTDNEAKALTEIDRYCRDEDGINRRIPVDKLYKQYNVSGFSISGLLSKDLIYSRSLKYPYLSSLPGDKLDEFEVCVTSLGVDVVRSLKRKTKKVSDHAANSD